MGAWWVLAIISGMGLAGRNVLIDGATETSETSHAESKKKSGVMSNGGLGFTLGSASTQATQTSHSEQTRGSTIGSVLGNVDIQAGKDLTIRGSDVVAGKDINLIGQNVDILAAQNENRSEQTYKSKSSGLTLALSGTVGSAMDAGYQTAKQARHEDDSRLSALQGIKAGLTGVQAWQAAQQAIKQVAQLLRVDLDRIQVGSVTLTQALANFANQLRMIRESLESRDYVSLSDILSYEIGQTVAQWRDALTQMRAIVD